MKISHIILVSFFFILILFSITTYINYRQSGYTIEGAKKYERSTMVVRNSNRFQRNFLNMVSGLRGYLLTSETSFIQTYDSAFLENIEILGELHSLVLDGSDQQILLDDIRQLQKYWVDEFAMPLLEAKRSAMESKKEKMEFNTLYRQKMVYGLEKDVQRSLQKKFSSFMNYEYAFRASNQESLTATLNQTRRITFFLTTVSVILGVCISIFIAFYISSRILKMVKMSNAIAAGDYNVHINNIGKSELGLLALSLNNMARMLGSSIDTLKRQKDELDQFAHIVSHDLKAPLRGIDNVVTWIEEDHSISLPLEVSKYLAVIKGRIIRAENLLNGVLSYARVGQEKQFKEIVNVADLLMEVRGYIPNRKGLTLTIHPDMPVLYTERIPLLQVFTNLIVNAFKYHDKERGEVKVYHRSEDQVYRFFVEDDGPGIDPAYHERIFAIFQTLHERDTVESVGVGLSIVRKILSDRGLSVDLSSQSGKGSIFSFTWLKTEIE